jgi:hypothetical protein
MGLSLFKDSENLDSLRQTQGSPLPEATVSEAAKPGAAVPEAAKPDIAKPKAGKSEVSRPVRRPAKSIKSEPIEVSPEIEVKEREPCIFK